MTYKYTTINNSDDDGTDRYFCVSNMNTSQDIAQVEDFVIQHLSVDAYKH